MYRDDTEAGLYKRIADLEGLLKAAEKERDELQAKINVAAYVAGKVREIAGVGAGSILDVVTGLTKERDAAIASCAAMRERYACYEAMLREKWGTADAQRIYSEAFGAWGALNQASDAGKAMAEKKGSDNG